MCRILELIIRNYKQSAHQSGEEAYSRQNLIGAIEEDDKTSFEREGEESASYFQPTENIPNGMKQKLTALHLHNII